MVHGSLPAYPFAQASHERLSDRRNDHAFLARAWDDPATRVLVIRAESHINASRGGSWQLATNTNNDELRFVSPADAPAGERMLLGEVDGAVHFLVLAADATAGGLEAQYDRDTPHSAIPVGAGEPVGERFSGLRQLATQLSDVHASLAVHAVALASWHHQHPRCAICGATTEVGHAGALRRCPECSAQHFPRTDPAVIMLVVDDQGRCLLGHNSGRARGWFSTLAGFVEPGESPEQAVAREVREETGVVVGDLRYAGSQPWPFPSSLMLGYFARATATGVTVDGEEITEARWFSRDELRRAVESGAVALPTTISIAGALITSWYGGPLPLNVLRA